MSPCPFCGKPPLEKLRRLGSVRAASYALVCSGCRAIGPLKPSPAEAEAAWDNRTLGRAEYAAVALWGTGHTPTCSSHNGYACDCPASRGMPAKVSPQEQ